MVVLVVGGVRVARELCGIRVPKSKIKVAQ
jgi:hypothetical protein